MGVGGVVDLHLLGDFTPFRKAFVLAKERAGLDTEFRPVAARPGCGRVLVLLPRGEDRPFHERLPRFACEWQEVKHGSPIGLCSRALRWYATGEGSPHTVEDWLNVVIGPGVRSSLE